MVLTVVFTFSCLVLLYGFYFEALAPLEIMVLLPQPLSVGLTDLCPWIAYPQTEAGENLACPVTRPCDFGRVIIGPPFASVSG